MAWQQRRHSIVSVKLPSGWVCCSIEQMCGCSTSHPCPEGRYGCVTEHMKCSIFCTCNCGSEFCNKQTRVAALLDDDNDNDTAAGPIYYHIGSKYNFNLHIVFSFSNLFNHLHSFRYFKYLDRNLFT